MRLGNHRQLHTQFSFVCRLIPQKHQQPEIYDREIHPPKREEVTMPHAPDATRMRGALHYVVINRKSSKYWPKQNE